MFAIVPGMPATAFRARIDQAVAHMPCVRCRNFIASVLSDELAIEWADANR